MQLHIKLVLEPQRLLGIAVRTIVDYPMLTSEMVQETLNNSGWKFLADSTSQTLLLIRLYVEEALSMWEPRIILKEVRADPDPVRGKVDINIFYQPKNTPDTRSLVYPFYLSPRA
ncbi:GPW/gp25 family protein [Scytonema sp. NUACC26]|uniref:GPW/gp25 family protein n=1 Tax=Scytonema sp. NUACC26 TaxID=3140176 RepID=UPI0034DC38C9